MRRDHRQFYRDISGGIAHCAAQASRAGKARRGALEPDRDKCALARAAVWRSTLAIGRLRESHCGIGRLVDRYGTETSNRFMHRKLPITLNGGLGSAATCDLPDGE
jgi:hypothetical protein